MHKHGSSVVTEVVRVVVVDAEEVAVVVVAVVVVIEVVRVVDDCDDVAVVVLPEEVAVVLVAELVKVVVVGVVSGQYVLKPGQHSFLPATESPAASTSHSLLQKQKPSAWVRGRNVTVGVVLLHPMPRQISRLKAEVVIVVELCEVVMVLVVVCEVVGVVGGQ
jgi:hypothetical protein